MNKLLLLFIPIALVVIVPTPCLGNANYKNICLNSSNYNGSATVTVYGGATGTCDSRIASSSFQGKNFATLSCINDFDSGDVSSSGIAQELIRYFEPDCCTDKKSICWKDFSKLCKTPSNYNGDGMLGNYRCNYYLHSVSDIDWNDPANTTSDSVKHHIRLFGQSCCSDGKSVLHVDYSKLCEDPSEYDKDATWDKYGSGNANYCEEMLSHIQHAIERENLIIENVDTNACDDYLIEVNNGHKVNLLQYMEKNSECCGAKGMAKNGCLPDYSKICKTPGNYNGKKSVTIGHNTLNCDTAIQHGMYQHLDFATLKCDDFSNNHDLEVLLAPSCCSDGKSLCWRDYSKLCEDPSEYDKDAKWDKHASGNMNVCGKFLTSHIRQAIEKENLIIEDVDSNTCDDYLIESGYVYGGGENTGEKINLLRYMELKSECCGTKGMAKDGCPKNHGPPAILVVIVCICFCTIFVGIGIAVKHKYKKKNNRGGITVVQNGGIEMFQQTTTSSNQYVIANNNNNMLNGQVAQPVAMQYRQQQVPVYMIQHVSSQLSVGTSNNEAFAQIQDELGTQVNLIPHQQNATSSNVGTILPQPIEISPYKITKSKT